MFFEEIKQVFVKFGNRLNIFLSENFNDGLIIPEEKLDLILLGLVFLFFIICFGLTMWLWRLKIKNNSLINASMREREKTVELLKKQNTNKEEKILKDKKTLFRNMVLELLARHRTPFRKFVQISS